MSERGAVVEALGGEQLRALAVDLERARSEGDEQIFAVLAAHGFPPLTDELRRQGKRCRVTPFPLFAVDEDYVVITADLRVARNSWLCVCPAMRVLLLRQTRIYATRSTGHHFREEWRAGYTDLSWAEFARLARTGPRPS